MMTESDIRKAANKLLGREGTGWRLVVRGDHERHVVFSCLVPVQKRVDFHLLEDCSNPAERIQEAIDSNCLPLKRIT